MNDKINKIIQLLNQEYGEKKWKKRYAPLDQLIQTILSQNTNDKNSNAAFSNLKRKYPTWERLLEASENDIAETIRLGGLANIKAKRIKEAIFAIKEERPELDLTYLKKLPQEEALSFLTALKGVGPKTAACVLLFSFGKPVLPVDTHIHRVSKRISLIGNVDRLKAHEILQQMVPEEQIYSFHINMIEHGRRICKTKPKCPDCVLNLICESATYFYPEIKILKTKK
ncbi:MAG: endonuclease III domain-containing protein [Candidatus Jordarchaeum sp.]|uniref:endonuclease III domain-containing protein n=1 Tax=Candidatus Jordarchaeum sp. TaxID=2823881 RepID=UPI00404A8490